MIEIIAKKFIISDDDDVVVCENYIRKLPGFRQLRRIENVIYAQYEHMLNRRDL